MKNQDEPAFPLTYVDKTISGVNSTIVAAGLTKREYFALTILNGILDRETHLAINAGKWSGVVDTSLKLADELLAKLEKQP